MGIMSEVAFCTSIAGYLKGLKFLAGKEIDDYDNILKERNHMYVFPDNRILIYLDYTKWYEGFHEDVDAFMEFMNTLDEDEYYFVRITPELMEDDESTVQYKGNFNFIDMWHTMTIEIYELDKAIKIEDSDFLFITEETDLFNQVKRMREKQKKKVG